MRPVLLFLPLVVASACTPTTQNAAEKKVDGVPSDLTYYRDIQPLLERSCNSCHTAGGIAPFALDSAEDAHDRATAMVGAVVDEGIMPPYYVLEGSMPTEDDTRFSADEKAILQAWADTGAPIGDESDSVHAQAVNLPTMRIDDTFDIGEEVDVTQLAESGETDHYHCFDIDLQFDADTAVTAFAVHPGNASLVHHVLHHHQDLAARLGLTRMRDCHRLHHHSHHRCGRHREL